MGLHPALVLCGALAFVGPVYALLSPLRTVRVQPGAETVQTEEAALPPDGELS